MVATVWLTRRSPSKNNEDGNANIRQLPEIILNIRRIINEITRIQQCPQRHHYAIAMIPLPWDTCMYFKTQTERIKLKWLMKDERPWPNIVWIYRISRDECEKEIKQKATRNSEMLSHVMILNAATFGFLHNSIRFMTWILNRPRLVFKRNETKKIQREILRSWVT